MAARKPGTLYHYCSLQTFQKIMENKSIWLSDVSKSNDSKELAWIKNECQKYISQSWITYLEAKKKNEFAGVRTEDFEKFQEALELIKDYDASKCWVFCLSEKKDDLGQWRGYADDGQGISIGFQRDLFELIETIAHRADENEELYFKKIKYSQKDIKEFLYDYAGMSEINEKLTSEEAMEIYKKIAVLTIWNAPFFKNEKFRDEKEWRIAYSMSMLDMLDGKKPGISNDKNDLFNAVSLEKFGYVIKNGELVSHLEMELPILKNVISSITLGPKCKVTPMELKLYLSSIGMYKDSKGKPIKILQSQASYR